MRKDSEVLPFFNAIFIMRLPRCNMVRCIYSSKSMWRLVDLTHNVCNNRVTRGQWNIFFEDYV